MSVSVMIVSLVSDRQGDRDITGPAAGSIIIGQFHSVLLREQSRERERERDSRLYKNSPCNSYK